MPRKPKMPQYAGLLLENGKFCGPLYKVTMQLAPDKFGISRDATNEEMVHGFLECINKHNKAATDTARAEGEAAGLARALAVVEARAAAREAQVDVAVEAGGAVDAVRLKVGELRAVAEEIRRAGAAPPAVTR